jgi:phosphodiesterase/alkaline phosphatase D-like protein
MAKKPSKAQKKVAKVMGEFKAGTLNTGKPGPGKGPKVKSRKQAIAIALSEAAKVKKGKKR